MSRHPTEPLIEGCSVVALGSFNPAIFHPQWFARNELLSVEEADGATVNVVSKDVSTFSTEWLKLQVEDGRFLIGTTDISKTYVLRDLVISTFRVLEHTPVRAVGLNYDVHNPLPSQEERDKIGDYYAPKQGWGRGVDSPKLAAMSIRGTRKDCDAAYVQVRMEPSPRSTNGVLLLVNQHYDLAEYQMDRFIRILEGDWVRFLEFSKEYCHNLIETPLQN